ncbi:MAG: nitrilase-related carbon-nitrogen hydrolase [Candidatus Thorarchaeota archaeon]
MTRLGIGQMEPKIGALEENLETVRDILNDADKKEVEVLVLPELANSGYVFESKEEVLACAETIPLGPFSKELLAWSKNQRLVVSGICEYDGSSLYNSAGIFGNGNHLATYRKAHLFNDEKDWFIPGNDEPPVVLFQDSYFGVMICWDWIFPEMARILALKGAQVILHPSNLVLEFCQTAMKTRSLENGVFSATANRVGSERGLEFSGNSQIVDTKGRILLRIPNGSIGVEYVDIDLSEANDKTLTPRNHRLSDRRPELYKRLAMDF